MSQQNSERYYQIVFVKMKDPEKFSRYAEQLRPVVSRYGGALERAFVSDSIHGESVLSPDLVNFVSYDSRPAFTAFSQDPAFRRIVPLRAESIEMAAVGGLSMRSSKHEVGIEQRLYVIEVARFGSHGEAGYRRYEAEAEPLMARYGYAVEHVLRPDDATGFSFVPDVVKIAYFNRLDAMEELHRDPDHKRVETVLYPAAVAQSVWVIGHVHKNTP